MTRLEKAKELRPDLTEKEIIRGFCAFCILPIECFDCKYATTPGTPYQHCKKCWNEPYGGEGK